jgi:hypothetical protein
MTSVVDAVADLLSRPENEDKSAEQLAQDVVDGMHRYWRSQTTDTPPALVAGRAYNFPWAPRALWISYRSRTGLLWMTDRESDYGLLIKETASALQYRTAGRSTLRLGGPAENKDGWAVGQRVHLQGAKAFRYRIVACTLNAVLLEGPDRDGFQAEPNASMARFFTKP